jgi:DNA-binding MarR family transcriptional regulator
MEVPLSTIIEFRNNIRILEREIEKYLKTETACCGVTFSQCHILLELELRGECSITQLAAILELDNSTLSRVIDGMVNAGLIERQVNPQDRRAAIVRLTEQGQTVANTINHQCNGFYQRVFQHLPQEKHTLVIEIIAMLSTALQEVRQSDVSEGQACSK